MQRPRKLDGHLDKSRQEEEEAHYFKWVDEEYILISWLRDSTIPEVSVQLIDYAAVKDIRETVIPLNSKLEDAYRMAELNRNAMGLLQEQKSVLEVSNESTTLWNEDRFLLATYNRSNGQRIHFKRKEL